MDIQTLVQPDNDVGERAVLETYDPPFVYFDNGDRRSASAIVRIYRRNDVTEPWQLVQFYPIEKEWVSALQSLRQS